MTDHGIAVLNKVMSTDIDSFNRSAVSASADIDNGNVFQLLTQSTAATGRGEVWLATIPTTASSGLKNLWMAYSPEVVEVVSGSNVFKGIDSDPTHFVNLEGEFIDAFFPQIGDLIILTGDALGGSKASNGYVVATNNTYQLTWAASGISGLSLALLATTFVSKGTAGAIGETQHVTAYQFQVTAIA